MKRILALLLAATLCFCLLASAAADDAPAMETLNPGDAIPDFTVTESDGTVFTLSEALATHKAVMVNLWGTWCHNCVDEMPFMQKAYADYSEDVALICLTAFDDDDAINAFKEQYGLDLLPCAQDTVGLTNAVVWDGYPTTIIIDRFGNYAFYECGAIRDTSKFTRMWDFFISDDYTETQVIDEIPGARFQGTYPTDEELSAALCADGSLTFTYDHDDTELWPFVVTDNGVVNSNALQSDTVAAMSTTVSAKAGDVFAFDYSSSLQTIYDMLNIDINGESIKPIYYSDDATWTYEFPADGDYEITFLYGESVTAETTDTAGTVVLSNARLVSGDDAAALLASLPATPHSLEGEDFELQILNENAKRFDYVLPEEAGTAADIFGERAEFYLVPDDTVQLRALLGEDWDTTQACVLGSCDSPVYLPCALMDTDDEGYVGEVSLFDASQDSDLQIGMVVLYADIQATDEDGNPVDCGAYVFQNEESIRYLISAYTSDDEGNVPDGVTWVYEDGTQPAGEAAAETADAQEAAATPEHLYTITLVDENGEPVIGAMINICDNSNCNLQKLTDTNTFSFDGINNARYPYIIHVIKVPEGYSFDTAQEFVLNESGDSLTITIPHA